jgi:AcrR family transcriptional regulator
MVIQAEKTQDLRVRRTRHLLQQAFMELMREKGFQSITVQDVAERAMVNRATFYDHFVDKYDLLEYSIREWFKQTLFSKMPEDAPFSTENLQLIILTTCDFLSKLRGHCLPKDHEILPLVQTQITTLITEILLGWLSEEKLGEALAGTPPQLAATITSWAIYGVALYWSQEDRRTSPQDFTTQVLPTILASLNQRINAAVS